MNIDFAKLITAEDKAAALLAQTSERSLRRAEFEYLLALTGLDDVWAALEAALKDSDRALYATIRAQRVQEIFRLSRTLEFVDQVRELAAVLLPDADLQESSIRAAWGAVATR